MDSTFKMFQERRRNTGSHQGTHEFHTDREFSSEGGTSHHRGSGRHGVGIETAVVLAEAWSRLRQMWFDVMGSSRKVGQHHALLNQLSKETPPGYNNIRVDQLVRADRELFTILSQEMQGSLKPGADGVAPLDARVRALITDPRITMFMLPLPSSQKAIKEDIERNALKDDPAKVEKPPELKKVKKQRAEKACPEELKKFKMNYSHGRICWAFNLKDGCSLSTQKQDGKPVKCNKGYHVCANCHKPGHGAASCRANTN